MITPRELADHFAGARKRILREHNELVSVAWLSAHLTAYAPGKARDFPKLDGLLTEERVPVRRQQTWEEQLVVARQWAAVTG